MSVEDRFASASGSTPHRVTANGLRHSFGDLEVLRDLSLHAEQGEFVTILGPSGGGKSTFFSVLTGASEPSSGEILVDGAPVTAGGAHFAFMPQKDALLPWRRVLDNMTLGLEVQGVKRSHARERVRPLIPAFGLDGFEDSYPFELSGGMRQRAALLRTVVQDRDVLLLDEPFGALDALTRTQMQAWLEKMWEEFRWTVLLITHDVREAVFLSDRIYVFSQRPATVVAEIEVPLPRPRTIDMVTDPMFAGIEAQLLKILLQDPEVSGDVP